ncbi:MAG: selenium cofactor biosynthesis protein YqeC [Wenzhouxiangella sp.]|nr:selenium cofactor biosynthesis protein YqeC [Wenzhouxiangella sp.]
MSELATELGLSGIVAAVGAGGKKSVLNEIISSTDKHTAWTGTVFTARPPRWTGVEVFVESEERLLALAERASRPGRYAFLKPSDKPARYGGLSPEGVARLHEKGGFELTLVKADGARMRGLKCPKPGEPVLPPQTSTILMILSAQVIGQVLSDEIVHRPERVAEVCGRQPGDTLTPGDLAAVFTRPGGISQGTEGKSIIPIINQVDDEASLAMAREAARLALDASNRFDRVILTCLHRNKTGQAQGPIVDVIRRRS